MTNTKTVAYIVTISACLGGAVMSFITGEWIILMWQIIAATGFIIAMINDERVAR